jgi:hypothetical protein
MLISQTFMELVPSFFGGISLNPGLGTQTKFALK